MGKRISIEEASLIYNQRFSDSTATERSQAYKNGFADSLEAIATGVIPKRSKIKPGTPEFDAMLSGYEHAKSFVNDFIARNKKSSLGDNC